MIVKSLLVPASIFAEVKSGCSPVITPPAAPIPPVGDTGASIVDTPLAPGIAIGGGGGFVPYPNNEATPPAIPDKAPAAAAPAPAPAAADGLGGGPAFAASFIAFCVAAAATAASLIAFCVAASFIACCAVAAAAACAV